MKKLINKRALITGGTSGIGLETARQFLDEGARVAVTGTNPVTLAAARRLLGSQVMVIEADAGEVDTQHTIAQQIAEAFGGLDAVFVNAGVADFRPITAFDENAFDHLFDVNLKGPYFLVQALLPLLANPSSIVLNGSINAHMGMPNSSLYAASKAGLISLARTLSGELAGRGIRVNAVSPGPVTTPIYAKLGLSADQSQAMAQQIIAKVPLGRFGTPEEIAKAVVFLASDDSTFALGSELRIDGRMSMA